MTPVDQTLLSPPDGNCFAACVASVLDLPLGEVPNFHSDDWLDRWNDWFRGRGLALINIVMPPGMGPPGYSILAADSPRGPWLHAVVCLDGEVVHDPHPMRAQGLGERKEWTVFLSLNPSGSGEAR